MNDSDTIISLREAFADAHLRTNVGSVLARGRVLRRRRYLPALAASAVASCALAVVAGAQLGGPEPGTTTPLPTSPPAGLAAWTVTEGPKDVVGVTVRQMADVAGLQARLRADGVPVIVSGSLALPAGCSNWHHGRYDMENVITSATQSGLPTKSGIEFSIRSALIPPGAVLWIGLSQIGAPMGSPGPKGPVASGFMSDTVACYDG